MGFYEVLDQAVALLRQRGRVTYRALKREFNLDDACLEDLKDKLVNAQHTLPSTNMAPPLSPLRTTPQSPASR